ncbi:MerR family transcriptional regulator [Clostridium botulinum]|uniref:MerR family transcriptional regulator n=1 Tax=Clostridium botulinum TaxID=1491 RepID=UPI00052BD7DA|nr:MerR family transcriptional regulator [Clostridium botulinum]KGM95401.1 transcriptional regulator [Clostridium botulinum D str. CCUG 7971]NFO97486.1 MerR family transcriptional regulator [Clostridium botulinum]OOV51416.1 transcriptional regulator [Clostridium botulinum D/C]OOV58601.1 transcriptional regulator [Clostridium botulinum D/C]OOV59800.1 transcriptional regulator [Clostridium botulinum D/C]
MNIKLASEKTGLTKKAIKYYESVGLINPSKNSENNYRDYTEEDIIKLNLIASLRILDIPISEIKLLIEGNKTIDKVMKDTLKTINDSRSNLEKSKLIISNIIEKENKDFYVVGEEVKKLRETLEYSMEEKREYIYETLIRIFPGNFGSIVVSIYEPFLKIYIDNDEKKEAWIKLVDILDDLECVDESNPMFVKLANIDYDKLDNSVGNIKTNIYNILNGGEEEIEKQKKAMVEACKELYSNEAWKKSFNENCDMAQDMFETNGEKLNEFDKCLEILNEDCKRYNEIMKKINDEVNEEVKKEFGFTREKFLKSLSKN